MQGFHCFKNIVGLLPNQSLLERLWILDDHRCRNGCICRDTRRSRSRLDWGLSVFRQCLQPTSWVRARVIWYTLTIGTKSASMDMISGAVGAMMLTEECIGASRTIQSVDDVVGGVLFLKFIGHFFSRILRDRYCRAHSKNEPCKCKAILYINLTHKSIRQRKGLRFKVQKLPGFSSSIEEQLLNFVNFMAFLCFYYTESSNAYHAFL